eukprot:69702_1
MAINQAKALNIIHFNDVYNIVDGNNGGGAARFMTVIKKLKSLKPEPLIFFSGDFLSPSNISTVTKGKHMIPIMNHIGITCGQLGNHDLDYGNKHCIECLQRLNYPTLNTNILTPIADQDDQETDSKESDNESELEPLGKCKKELIIKHNGLNIGIIGISENWCNTLPIKPKRGIIYKDFITQCSKYVAKIRSENDLDVVIVLTHSRKQNDILLANQVPNIDIILGGHDHLYHVELNPKHKSLLVKSGCDFKGATYIQLRAKDAVMDSQDDEANQAIVSELNDLCLEDVHEHLMGINYQFSTFHYNINHKVPPDATMLRMVKELSESFLSEIAKPIGAIDVSLDTRFKYIRKQEMVSCNLICDIVRNAYQCDIVLLCGGGIRSDKIHKKGAISYKDILDLVPFQDPIIVKRISGKNIITAIQHSIKNLPKLDGRFAHVSGLKYVYDSSKKSDERLINVQVNTFMDEGKEGEQMFVDIEEEKYYSLATRQYTMNGGDGFDSLNDATNETLVGEDTGAPLCIVLRNFFWCISTINDVMKLMDGDGDKELMEDIQRLTQKLWFDTDQSEDNMSLKIEPQIEGRIVDVAEIEKNDHEENKAKVVISGALAPLIASPRPYNKLSSFVNMTHKPKRRKSIHAFISNLVN